MTFALTFLSRPASMRRCLALVLLAALLGAAPAAAQSGRTTPYASSAAVARADTARQAPAVAVPVVPPAPFDLDLLTETPIGLTGTAYTIDAEAIAAGRYGHVNHVLADVPGFDAASAYNDRPGLRGSPIEASAFTVDGLRLVDPLTNRPYYRVPLDAVAALRVHSGGLGARYGDVRSGLVAVDLKDGGERLAGSLNLQLSPPGRKHVGPMLFGFDSPLVQPFVDPAAGAFTGNAVFDGWNAVAEGLLADEPYAGRPEELYALWLWRHRSPDAIAELRRLEQAGVVRFADGVDPDAQAFHDYGTEPDYRASATLGGPVPGLPVRFFASYDTERTAYAYPFARPHYRDHHLWLKLTAALGPRLSLTGLGFVGRQWGGDGDEGPGEQGWISNNPFRSSVYPGRLWYPDWASPGRQTRQAYLLRLAHQPRDAVAYEVHLTHTRTDYGTDQEWRDTYRLPQFGDQGVTGLSEGRLGTEADIADRLAAGDASWQNWRDWARIRVGDVWYDEMPHGYTVGYAEDVTGFYALSAGPLDTLRTVTRTYALAAHLQVAVASHHRITAGVEIQRSRLDQDWSRVAVGCCEAYVSASQEASWQSSLYAEDRLTLGDLTATIGLRLDAMLHPSFPVLDGEGEEGPFSDWVGGGNMIYRPTGQFIFPDEAPNRRVVMARVSPRLGVGYTLRPPVRLFANYGHYYQWPSLIERYGIRYIKTRGYALDYLGNPALRPPRTVAYEAGTDLSLRDWLRLRLTAYAHDVRDEVGAARYYFEGDFDDRFYTRPANLYVRDVHGLEARLAVPRGALPFVSAWLRADYRVERLGAVGFDRRYEDPDRPPRPAAPPEPDPDVRPLVKLNLALHTPAGFGPGGPGASLLGGLDVSLHHTWKRGAAFTWNPLDYPGVTDNVRWRPYRRWDLRLAKQLLTAGGATAVFYLDVVNLFNQRNLTPPVGRQDVTNRPGWAWDEHYGLVNQFVRYMESLDLTVQPDGSVTGADRPGDWRADHIAVPDFTPWAFLERRDLYVGLRLVF